MNKIDEFVAQIKSAILQKDYLKSVELFKRYHKFLTTQISKNGASVELVCQLAAVKFELSDYDDKNAKRLNEFLNSHTLSPKDRARVYTNLAFYYKEAGNEKDEINALKRHFLALKDTRKRTMLMLLFSQKKTGTN